MRSSVHTLQGHSIYLSSHKIILPCTDRTRQIYWEIREILPPANLVQRKTRRHQSLFLTVVCPQYCRLLRHHRRPIARSQFIKMSSLSGRNSFGLTKKNRIGQDECRSWRLILRHACTSVSFHVSLTNVSCQVTKLCGYEPLTKYVISGVVALQFLTAYLLRNSPFFSLKFLLTSYVIGATANQNVFLCIHELSHNLGFKKPIHNRLFSIFANLPIGIPYSASFRVASPTLWKLQQNTNVYVAISPYPPQTLRRCISRYWPADHIGGLCSSECCRQSLLCYVPNLFLRYPTNVCDEIAVHIYSSA
jgi:hypothetical protein